MIAKNKGRLYFIIFSILITFIDQLSKYFLNTNEELFIKKDLIFFTLDFVKNYGAAFNIFTGSRIFLSIVSISFSIILIYLILRKKFTKNIDLYSYSFLLGGSLGNGLDRIFKGYVLDFINLKFVNFPVFNIADISINIGFLLILYSLAKSKN